MNTTNCYFSNGIDMTHKIFESLNFNFFMENMPIILSYARGMSDIKGSELNRRGYLTIMNGTTGEIGFTVPFGEIPEEKREKYFEFSQEKAKRLFSNLQNGHTTSFESRNEEQDKYGGAIYLDYNPCAIILSFSGMPELIDEAMMLALGSILSKEILSSPKIRIEACKRNQYWRELAILVHDDF